MEHHLPQTAEAGLATLARMRAEGKDPAHGGDAARRRGASNSQRARERAEWERRHGDIDLGCGKRAIPAEDASEACRFHAWRYCEGHRIVKTICITD